MQDRFVAGALFGAIVGLLIGLFVQRPMPAQPAAPVSCVCSVAVAASAQPPPVEVHQ